MKFTEVNIMVRVGENEVETTIVNYYKYLFKKETD